MLPALDSCFKTIESQRLALLGELKPLSSEQLTFKPAADSWSVTEVMEHLVIAEELSLKALERPAPPAAERGSALRSGLKLRLLDLAFRLPVRIKVPSERLRPTGTATLLQLAERWGEARCRLAGVLDAVTPELLGDPRWRHPILGWLTSAQWVDFIEMHTRHHTRQVRRIRAALAPTEGSQQIR